MLEEAEDDLEKLGLVLDNLQIQNIADDVKYLDSLGRQQQAELLRDARIAEAETQAESQIKSAENGKKTALKRIETQVAIAQAEADRRLKDALTKRQALVAEAESDIAAAVAKAEANLEVQKARIDQVQAQLQADVIAPAEAACALEIAKAKADASKIIEEGRARAEGIQELARSWAAAGPYARDVFLFQKIDQLLQTLVETVPEVSVQSVTVVDGSGGDAATQVATFIEQLRHITGINLGGQMQQWFDTQSPSKKKMMD